MFCTVPRGLGDRGSQIFVATTVLLMLLTPLLSVAGQRLTASRSTSASRIPDVTSEDRGPREDHVVIVGWGPVSVRLGRSLLDRGVQVTLTTLNPPGAREAEEAGLDVISGDALHQQVLLDAGVARAKAVIIAEHAVENATKAVTTARTVTSAPILLRPLEGMDLEAFAGAGVDHVVDPDSFSHRALLTALLDLLALPRTDASRTGTVDTTRVFNVDWSDDQGCSHGSHSVPVLPRTAGCEECEVDGQQWVHLRVCLTCGHVGCCDSSPGQHARAHYHQNTHPLLASGENGQAWAYCFADDLTIDAFRPG